MLLARLFASLLCPTPGPRWPTARRVSDATVALGGHAQSVDQPVPRRPGREGIGAWPTHASSTPSRGTKTVRDLRDAQMLARLARVDLRRYCIPSNMVPPRRSTICLASNCATPWSAPASTLSTPCASPSRVSAIVCVIRRAKRFTKRCWRSISPTVSPVGRATVAHRPGARHRADQRLWNATSVGAQQNRDPVTQRLQQIAGVGPLTALCFVLKIGDPHRFSRGRDVGAYRPVPAP